MCGVPNTTHRDACAARSQAPHPTPPAAAAMQTVVMQAKPAPAAQKAAAPRRSVKAGVQLPGAVDRALEKNASGPIILDGTVSHHRAGASRQLAGASVSAGLQQQQERGMLALAHLNATPALPLPRAAHKPPPLAQRTPFPAWPWCLPMCPWLNHCPLHPAASPLPHRSSTRPSPTSWS